MIKKLTITGCALLLLTACNSNTANENMGAPIDPMNDPNYTNVYNNPNNMVGNPDNGMNAGNPTLNNMDTIDITNLGVSMKEAVQIFSEAYPNTKIDSIDLDYDYGRLYYDIDGFDGTKEYDVAIDAMTKEMREMKVEPYRETKKALDFSSVMDPNEAIQIASQVGEVEGLYPMSWSLDVDYGMQIYSIDYYNNGYEIEVKINANSGEILEVEIDD